jgi:hypothetical protein
MATEFQFSPGLGYTLLRRCDGRLERVFSRDLAGCLHRLHVGFPVAPVALALPRTATALPSRVAAPSLLQLHFRRGDCWQAVGVDPQDAWELHPLGFPAAMDERPRERPCSPDVPDQTILIGRISHGDGDG